ncbi:MAG TPA: glycosyltransferase family 87 protein [Candidatus Binatia bacterium]
MRRRRAAACLAFLAVTAAVAWRTYADCNVVGQPDLPRFGMQDFRDAVYYPARAFLDGVSPYDPHPYLERYPVSVALGPYAPAVLPLYSPLVLLDVRIAEAAFFLANAGLAVALAATILVMCGVAATLEHVLGLAALLVLGHPGHSTLFLGQCTFYVLIGAFLALYWAERRPWAAALAFAVAVLKPTYGAPLGLMMLVLGAWRPVIAGGLLSGLVSLAALGRLALASNAATIVQSFAASLGHMLALGVNRSHTSLRIDAPGLLERVTGIDASGAGGVAITLAVLLAGAVALRRAARSGGEPHLVRALVCLTMLGGMYHQGYDTLALALPATAIAVGAWRPCAPLGTATWRLLFALLLVPAANYLSTYHFATRFGVVGPAWLVLASANGAAVALAFVLCVAVAWAGDADDVSRSSAVPRRSVAYRR